MIPAKIDYKALQLFLKCPKKSIAEEVIQKCFNYRESEFPTEEIESYKETFQLTVEELRSLFQAMTNLIKAVLFYQVSDAERISSLFPSSFHAQLKTLISTIISSKYASWNEETFKTQLSLPKYQNMEWNIHLKASQSGSTHVTVPTALVKIQIEKVDHPDSSDYIEFEMGKETLQAMLDGLGKIRDQLQSVAGQ